MSQANIARLARFVSLLVKARVKDSAGWKTWRNREGNEVIMAEIFQYDRQDDMPAVTSLVKPFFHPSLPLIGLNYTQVAHNTLHAFPSGWTDPLRLCRGIVFSRRGRLVAMPFPKFFNYGEHAETRKLPDLPFVATIKQDGHLGIIFEYEGQLLGTTRGSFVSSSSELLCEMLPLVQDAWIGQHKLPKDVTALCEIIDPSTHVIVDYGDSRKLVLIGAFNRRTLEDYDHKAIARLARRLSIEATPVWSGDKIEDLARVVSNKTYLNQEGFVARYANGLRVKFKFAGYISQMLADKLNHSYIMQRLMDDSFDKRFGDLDAEIQMAAQSLASELKAVLDTSRVPADKKSRWGYLYALDAERKDSAYYRGICRKFLAWLEQQAQ